MTVCNRCRRPLAKNEIYYFLGAPLCETCAKKALEETSITNAIPLVIGVMALLTIFGIILWMIFR